MRKSVLLIASIILSSQAFAAADRQIDAGVVQLKEMVSAPATPSAGYVNTYGLSDGYRYFMNSSGTQFRLLDASSFGTNGQLWRTNGSAIGLTTSTFPSTNAVGDLLFGSGLNAYGNLAIGTGDQLLGANAGATSPEYKAATVTAGGAGTFPGALRSNTSLILEDPGAGTDTITLQASTPSAGSYALNLPTADGVYGDVVKTDGEGNLRFEGPLQNEVSSAASITLDFNTGEAQRVELEENATVSFSNARVGAAYLVILVQGGTGGYTVTWPGTVKWGDAEEPVLSGDVGKIDLINFYYDGTNFLGSYAKGF